MPAVQDDKGARASTPYLANLLHGQLSKAVPKCVRQRGKPGEGSIKTMHALQASSVSALGENTTRLNEP